MDLVNKERTTENNIFKIADIKDTAVLSVEEYLDIDNEFKTFSPLYTIVDELVIIVRKDASIGIDNKSLFHAKPYKDIISGIDKMLSKRYGIVVVHVASNGKYQAYVDASHARNNLIKLIKKGRSIDKKEVDDILNESSNEIPKIRNGKAFGRREEGKNITVKADFYDLIINKEIDSKKLTYMILGEMRSSLGEIEKMNNLVDFGKNLFTSLQDHGIDKTYVDVLGGDIKDIESKTGISKMRTLINGVIDTQYSNAVHTNAYKPYMDGFNDMNQNRIPLGTRISYVILLMLIIAAISIFGPIITVSNIVLIAQLLVLYVAWIVAYAIYTLLYKIITGHDTPDTRTKRISGFELLSSLLFTNYVISDNNTNRMNDKNSFMKDVGGSNISNDVVTKIFNNRE